MKKQFVLIFIFISLLLGSCCEHDKKCENDNQTTHLRVNIGAPASDSDDLIVLLYFNVIDADYDNYTYSFIHKDNEASGKKVKLNNPTKTTSAGAKVGLEPSFIVLNFGQRGKLTGPVDYKFKIEREDKDGKTEPLDDYKNKYTFEELKAEDSKIVIQSVKVTYNAGTTLPIIITPPIKPSSQPQ